MKKKSGTALIITGLVFFTAGIYVNYWRFRRLIGCILYYADPEPKIGVIGGIDPVTVFFLDMNIIEKAGLLLVIIAPAIIVTGIIMTIINRHKSN